MNEIVNYVNGKILTMDARMPVASAFQVSGGRFSAVSSDSSSMPVAPDRTVDLAGATVVAGLIDAHTHLESSALAEHFYLDLRDRSLAELLETVEAHVADDPERWIVVQASSRQQAPTKDDLDRVAPRTPVIVRVSVHLQIVNSAALAGAGLDQYSPTPRGMRFGRTDDGQLDGRVEEAFDLFPVGRASVDATADFLEATIREFLLPYGVTTVYEIPFSAQGVRAYQQLHRQGRLAVRISLNPTIAPGLQPLADSVATISQLGLQSGFGDERLWFGAAKIFLDGDGTAAFDSSREAEHPSSWGVPTQQYSDLVNSLVSGFTAGVQVWMHALGADAQRLALDAVEEARRIVGPGDFRPRIEHILNHWSDGELIDRVESAGVIPVLTAAFMGWHSDGFVHAHKPHGAFPFRTLLDRGFMPPGNSDTAGTQPFALNPWHGIAAMVRRQNAQGEPVNPSEAVSVDEGIRCYTQFGAHAGFREASLGSITVGKHADFAVLNQDPTSVDPDQIIDTRALATVVAGEVVWGEI